MEAKTLIRKAVVTKQVMETHLMSHVRGREMHIIADNISWAECNVLRIFLLSVFFQTSWSLCPELMPFRSDKLQVLLVYPWFQEGGSPKKDQNETCVLLTWKCRQRWSCVYILATEPWYLTWVGVLLWGACLSFFCLYLEKNTLSPWLSGCHQQYFYLTFILYSVHVWPAGPIAWRMLTYSRNLQHRHNPLLHFV